MGRFGSKNLLDGYLQGESDSICSIDKLLDLLHTAGALASEYEDSFTK